LALGRKTTSSAHAGHSGFGPRQALMQTLSLACVFRALCVSARFSILTSFDLSVIISILTPDDYIATRAKQSASMSSIVDAVLRSDNAPDVPPSDAPSRRRHARSSSRLRAPPSVSTPGMQSDVDGFPDDEVVGLRGTRRQMPNARDVPRVVDTTAETLGIQFERFLEKYGLTRDGRPTRATDKSKALPKILHRQRHRYPAL